jgi:NAD(P)-dependent dehydrogenase (short-subunit alcohol dehydrogenase family)
MGRNLTGGVVVLTGASSGVGRATGLEFARHGAGVVLAGRRADALEELARECEAAGGKALAVPTDVTDEAAMAELARRAVEGSTASTLGQQRRCLPARLAAPGVTNQTPAPWRAGLAKWSAAPLRVWAPS